MLVHRNSALEDLPLVVDVVGRVPHANHSALWWSKVRRNILERHGLKSFEGQAAKPRAVECESCARYAEERKRMKEQPQKAPAMWVHRGGNPETLGLSEAEVRVLAVIAEGLSTRQAAARLNLTENTVKTHLSRTYKRIGATTAAQAVAIAVRAGVI